MRSLIGRSLGPLCSIGLVAAGLAVSSIGGPARAADAPTTGFQAVVPARLADTRDGGSTIDGGGPHGRLAAGTTTRVLIAGRAGVAVDASAVALNVTVAQAGGTGYLTVYPCDGEPPNASNLNVDAGTTVPNAVLAKLDGDGNVCLYTSVGADVIVDVAGWFPAAGAGFTALRPQRLADTRPGAATVDSAVSGVGLLANGNVLTVPVAGRGGVPAGVGAVAVNVTAVEPRAAGYLTVYPCGGTPPNASNVNFVAGQTIANQVLVPLGGGQICVFTSAPTHVLVDVAGSFTADASSFEGLAPVRLADTREGGATIDGASQGVGVVSAHSELATRVIGRGGVTSAAGAVALNVTAVQMDDAGYLTVYPCGQQPPNASNVNYARGQTIANSVTVKVGAGGTICVYSSAGGHVIVDVAGFFPNPGGSASPDPGSVELAAGFGHTCARRTTQVWCWGANEHGQLGDGTWTERPMPTEVSGAPATVAIAAGSRHTCALGADGRVRCWGANDVGQLGDSTTTDRATPTVVAGLPAVVAIGAGTDHTCAIDATHRVWCWGANDDDEMLTGDGSEVRSPQLLTAVGDDIATLDGGGSHTCAIRLSGNVVCWGANYFGQLGGGALEPETGLANVVGLPAQATAISAGWVHSCAVLVDGSLWCWGNGDAGQLGTGESSAAGELSVDRPTPVRVVGLTGVVDVAAASGHTCASLGDGTVRCWGLNFVGQLGDGSQDNRVLPVVAEGIMAASQVSAVADGDHTCVVEFAARLRCWGRNAEGQLGNTDVGSFAWTPVSVAGW